MQLKQIGIIHSPYKQKEDAPRQGFCSEKLSEIEIFEEFADGMDGVDEKKKLLVLYWGDRADRRVIKSKTPFSQVPLGVFTSRSPNRPNPIAVCIADVVSITGRFIKVKGLDALDQSPLLDIKVHIETEQR